LRVLASEETVPCTSVPSSPLADAIPRTGERVCEAMAAIVAAELGDTPGGLTRRVLRAEHKREVMTRSGNTK
jgi:hypothetical protein